MLLVATKVVCPPDAEDSAQPFKAAGVTTTVVGVGGGGGGGTSELVVNVSSVPGVHDPPVG